MPPDTQSAKGKRIVPVRGVGNKTEYSEQLTSLLASNDFRDRIKGIDQLLADCQHNSNMVINTIFPVSPRLISAAFFVGVWMSAVRFDHFLKTSLVLHSGVWCLQGQAAGVQQQSQPTCSGISPENHQHVKKRYVSSGQHPVPGNCRQSPQFKEQCHLFCCGWSY